MVNLVLLVLVRPDLPQAARVGRTAFVALLLSFTPFVIALDCGVGVLPTCTVGDAIGRDNPTVVVANATLFTALVNRHLRAPRETRSRVASASSPRDFSSIAELDLATIALHAGHDAGIAIAIDGRIQCVLELERLLGRRYAVDPGPKDWLFALETVKDKCECDEGPCPKHFGNGVLVHFSAFASQLLPQLVELVFSVSQWRTVNHHEAHALMGFHQSPFRSALVVSYDGGGNDGVFEAFVGRGMILSRIQRFGYNLGVHYLNPAILMREVGGKRSDWMCAYFKTNNSEKLRNDSEILTYQVKSPMSYKLSLAGKLMGYAGLAQPDPALAPFVRRYMLGTSRKDNDFPAPLLRTSCESLEGQRRLAASVQKGMEDTVRKLVGRLLKRVDVAGKVEGIVMTGGCALNVLVNQLIRDAFTEASSTQSASGSAVRPVDLYVPPAPNDAGLVVGAVWAVTPPFVRHPLQYVGFRLWDVDTLEEHARQRGARSLTALGGVDYLAALLAGESAWLLEREDLNSSMQTPIIAIVRGRSEFGPRALGHRSLVAVPTSHSIRERMNRLKVRQWYRPVAPMIADEALEVVFGHVVKSPYMESVGHVKEKVRKNYPAMAHVDGTARHQSVGQRDEPWLHALLMAVGRRIGLASIINTSFNSKGHPITNTIKESLQMLDTLFDLDYVLIEDWLFKAPPGKVPQTIRAI